MCGACGSDECNMHAVKGMLLLQRTAHSGPSVPCLLEVIRSNAIEVDGQTVGTVTVIEWGVLTATRTLTGTQYVRDGDGQPFELESEDGDPIGSIICCISLTAPSSGEFELTAESAHHIRQCDMLCAEDDDGDVQAMDDGERDERFDRAICACPWFIPGTCSSWMPAFQAAAQLRSWTKLREAVFETHAQVYKQELFEAVGLTVKPSCQCFCCGKLLVLHAKELGKAYPEEDRCWTTMEAAHVEAASTGGLDCLENLRPCCANCNKDMGTGLLWHFHSIWAEKPWYIASKTAWQLWYDSM